MNEYKITVGLETHLELSTKSKMYCTCPVNFGGKPNTRCCPTCLGLPGSLPVLNKSAVIYAIKMGLALNCDISKVSSMARKNYIYPDLAKAYQISQDNMPLCTNGRVTLSDGSVIRINRIHIEEDAGKLIHDNGKTYIDYNRAGVPLVEIVTEPDFTSASQVREYLETICLIARYIGISDCKMQEGSMRCDVNVSVKQGDVFGERCEIKNMNSFSNITKAIDAEFKRQKNIILNGGTITKQTLRYDEKEDAIYLMRSKEDASDYRYFAEPDIPPFKVDKTTIDTIKASIEELPAEKVKRYIFEYGISSSDAQLIVKYPPVAKYFEELSSMTNSPKLSCSVILTHILRLLHDEDSRYDYSNLPHSKHVAKVIEMVNKGDMSNNLLKNVIEQIFKTKKPLCELYDISSLKSIDTDETLKFAQLVVSENPKIVSDYKNGKTKAISALIGMIMKKTNGRADAETAHKLLKDIINRI